MEKKIFWQGFSYLSKSGSRSRLIWEKQLANIQNRENWTGITKHILGCSVTQV